MDVKVHSASLCSEKRGRRDASDEEEEEEEEVSRAAAAYARLLSEA